MRMRMLAGLIVASTATASCFNERTVAPLDPITAITLNTGEFDPCANGGCNPQGRMTGGGGQQVTLGDIYVTRGFTIHCDITLSNNVEVNWPGNKWHLDKPLTEAACIDDPNISPEPPPAPFDTFLGRGVGRLNGVDGSRIEFTFIDAGEPGGQNDKAGIRIYDPNGVLVLAVPLSFLTNGNIQAHEDQPHRNR